LLSDERPSLLNDIRYFVGTDHRSSAYLKDHDDAVAYGRRIALLLNSKRVSLGSYSALYVQFNPTLESGMIKITNEVESRRNREDWWQRYVHVGVPADFPTRADASEISMERTVEILKAIRPELSPTLDEFDRDLKAVGDTLRFLLKVYRTKRLVVEVSFNLPVWKQQAFLFLSATDPSSGEYFEAPPFPLKLYSDAGALAGTLKLNGDEVTLLPKASFRAQTVASIYGAVPSFRISENTMKSDRPLVSGLLNLS